MLPKTKSSRRSLLGFMLGIPSLLAIKPAITWLKPKSSRKQYCLSKLHLISHRGIFTMEHHDNCVFIGPGNKDKPDGTLRYGHGVQTLLKTATIGKGEDFETLEAFLKFYS